MPNYKGIVRYPHVSAASAAKGSDKKMFSLCLLFHKTDPQCQTITADHETAKQNGFPNGFPAKANTCWDDLALDPQCPPELKDYMQLKISTDEANRPVLCDAALQPVIDPAWDGTAAGKIVYVDCSPISAYDKGLGGVKSYLNGVMDTGEMGAIPAEKLSTKPTAEGMFGNIVNGGQTAAPVAQQQTTTTAAPPPPPPSEPQYVMTDKATTTREAYHESGWTDEQLIANGMMIQPSFA